MMFVMALAILTATTGPEPEAKPPTLVVQGSGEVLAASGMATIRVGVMKQDDRAEAAQKEVAKVAQKIRKAALSSGVSRESI